VRTLTRSDAILQGRTGRGVTVAVVDSGINPGHPHVGGVAVGVGFAADGTEHPDWVDRLGHGTAVAAAIREKAPDARLLAVRVFETALTTSVLALARAIDWAAAEGARLINLSLGTANPAHESLLQAAVERGLERGALVVSPAEHDGVRWLPGALPGAAGVQLDWDCPRDAVRIQPGSNGQPVLQASGYPRPIPGVPPERNLKGISFAAANATGLLALALEGRTAARTPEELFRLLG
jgi:subtilisin family serine protease